MRPDIFSKQNQAVLYYEKQQFPADSQGKIAIQFKSDNSLMAQSANSCFGEGKERALTMKIPKILYLGI